MIGTSETLRASSMLGCHVTDTEAVEQPFAVEACIGLEDALWVIVAGRSVDAVHLINRLNAEALET